MNIYRYGIRTNVFSAFVTILAIACLVGPAPASAQPIPDFLDDIGGDDLTDSNLGQSALAIQRTCAQLIALGGPNLTGNPKELFDRCGELVQTAAGLRDDGTHGPRSLLYSDSDELLAAFQQVNGEEAQATATIASTASNEQFSTIAARLGALRGATSASVTSVTANGTDFMYGSGGGAAADAGLPFGPWGWFFRGTMTTGDRDPSDPTSFNGEENGFEFDQYGLTVGIDHNSGAAVWGVAIGYTSYEVEMNQVDTPNNTQTNVVNGGTIESDSVNATIFYDHNSDNNSYFSALAGYGSQSFDMARQFVYFSQNMTVPNVTNQTRLLTASPNGDSISGSLAFGRIIENGGFIMDPYIGVTYDRIIVDSFSESDSGNNGSGLDAMQLAFDEQYIRSVRANLGVQLSRTIITGFGSMRPIFSVDYYHEFEDDRRSIRVKYALEDELAAGIPGGFAMGFGDDCISCFNLTSEAPDSDYFVVGAGIAAAYQSGLQAFLMFEGLAGYKNLEAYSLTLGIRGQF